MKYGNEEFILGLVNYTFGSSMKTSEELLETFKALVFTYFASNIKNTNKISKENFEKINPFGGE